MELQHKLDEALNTFKSFTEANEENLQKRDRLLEEKMQKMSDSITQAMEDQQKAQQQEMAELKVALNRTPPEAKSKSQKREELNEFVQEEFKNFLRKGSVMPTDFADHIRQNNIEWEGKSLSDQIHEDGGFLDIPTFGGLIEGRVFETSPMRSVATIAQTGSSSYTLVQSNTRPGASWTSETAAITETTTPTFNQFAIPVNGLYSEPRATMDVLEDAAVNLEAWLLDQVALELGDTENTAFVAGDGNGKPKGITSYDAWASAGVFEFGKIEQINSGAAAAFTADGLIDLQNSLPEKYQSRAAFMVKRSSFGEIMKLKDQENNYLFNRGLDSNTGRPFNLLAAPVIFADDMPAVAANALSAAYADFQMAYTIVDRRGLKVIRDEYTSKPFIKFFVHKRVGGGVTNFDAIKIQKIAS